MKIYLTILSLMLLAGQTCNRPSENLLLKLSPSIALDSNECIYFSYGFIDGQSIFSLDLKTKKITQLTERELYINFLTISPDHSKLAFVSYENDSLKGYYTGIWMMNPDGTGRKMVRGVPSEIIGLAFSPDNSRIYFAGALEFENYSPVAKPGFHNMDLVYTDTSGAEMELITNLGAYSIRADHQVTFDGQHIVTQIILNGDLMGAFKIPTDTVTTREELPKFNLLDETDVEIMSTYSKFMSRSKNLFHPAYSSNDSTIYYHDAVLIFKKRQEEPVRLIYNGSAEKVEDMLGIRSIYPFADDKRLLMVRENGPGIKDNGLYIIDAEDGAILEEIELDMSAFGSIVKDNPE